MKIKIDIECTPTEARAFLGLPDFTPVHDVMTSKMKDMAEKGVDPAEMQKLMQSWMTAGLQNMQNLQGFWQSASDTAGKSKK
jgi:hypothetical protein